MELLRDSIAGQLVRYATGNRYLLYPEEENGFVFKSMVVQKNSEKYLPYMLIALPIGGTKRTKGHSFHSA